MADSFPASGSSDRNLFEPRFSFVVSTLVIAFSVIGDAALVVSTWRTGEVIRRRAPRPDRPQTVQHLSPTNH